MISFTTLRIRLALITFLISLLSIHAQDTAHVSRRYIYVNPMLLATSELGISFEFQKNETIAKGIYLSYVYPNRPLEFAPIGFFSLPTLYYKGVSASYYWKKYKKAEQSNLFSNTVTNTKRKYKCLNINIKYKYFQDRWVYYGGFSGGMEHYSLLMDRTKVSVLIAYVNGTSISGKTSVLDLHFSLGIRTLYFDINEKATDNHAYYNYTQRHQGRYTKIYALPNITCGFTYGIQWFKK